MPTGPITVKIGTEPWVVPYIKLCIFFANRGWELDEKSFNAKILTGIKATG